MKADELLVLQYDNLSESVASLFSQLDDSPSLREYFIKNPTQVIAKYLLSPEDKLPAANISQGNRLLFSLLSNEGFMDWSRQFQSRIENRIREASESERSDEAFKTFMATLDREEIYREIIDAAQRYGDREMFYSLMVKDQSPESFLVPASNNLRIDVAVDIEIAIYAVLVLLVFAIDISFAPVEPLSRLDLRRISNLMSDRLIERAHEIRESGVLTSPDIIQRSNSL